jgi:hypothetical protein
MLQRLRMPQRRRMPQADERPQNPMRQRLSSGVHGPPPFPAERPPLGQAPRRPLPDGRLRRDHGFRPHAHTGPPFPHRGPDAGASPRRARWPAGGALARRGCQIPLAPRAAAGRGRARDAEKALLPALPPGLAGRGRISNAAGGGPPLPCARALAGASPGPAQPSLHPAPPPGRGPSPASARGPGRRRAAAESSPCPLTGAAFWA